jgi:DNA-binding NarL/FixJ family response regulator
MTTSEPKFLIIDSKATRRHSIQNLFFAINFEARDIEGVTSSDKALQLVGEKTYIAAFISTAEAYDWIELIKTIRINLDFNTLPIIVLSENPTRDKVLDAYDAGCNGFLKYPCSETDIEKVIAIIETSPKGTNQNKRITV